jgi:tetratricopeptide (TPR) repeat protein
VKDFKQMKANYAKPIIFFAAFLCAAMNGALAALDSGAALKAKPLPIADEFRAAVSELDAPAASPAERHEAYTRLARILQLSGNVEEAATAWENAAYSIPERRDDTALVESASCHVLMGEWDKAAEIVKLLLLTARDDKNISGKAVYLNGQIEMFKNGNSSALEAIAGNPEYIAFRPAVYYTLFQVSGKNVYKTKLVNEFPASPEAYSVISGGPKLVSMLPAPHWVLFPGRENVNAGQLKSGGTAGKTAVAGLPSLQAGLYKDKKNASMQVERLKEAGFDASVTQRTASGSVYWIVSVRIPPGSAMKNAISRLKERGFEAFPSPLQSD